MVVEGELERRQRFKDILYVDLRTAHYTDMKIRKGKFDVLFHELKNSLTR